MIAPKPNWKADVLLTIYFVVTLSNNTTSQGIETGTSRLQGDRYTHHEYKQHQS